MIAITPELKLEIDTLYAAYARALDDGPLEDWPRCFVEDCFYQIISRENVEHELPLAIMRCESRAMLEDRVTAVRETMMYEPRYLRHHITNISLLAGDGGQLIGSANFSVIEILSESLPRIAMTGRYDDAIDRDGDSWRFRSKRCIYDSTLIPNSVIYPV
jgi:anthranilate 1,2-dioxygenase small subunit